MSTADTTELLAQLRGIHLPPAPEPPSLWPIAIAVVLIALALLTLLLKQYRARRSWASDAIRELKFIQARAETRAETHAQNDADSNAMYSIAVLLKRIALTEGTDNSVKHLTGQPWLSYLDSFFNTHYFSRGNGQVFGSEIYRQNKSPDQSLYAELTRLIRRRQWFHD